ncbi:MAG: DUF4124 domain-containing protein [Pseudomonadota bacterium]
MSVIGMSPARRVRPWSVSLGVATMLLLLSGSTLAQVYKVTDDEEGVLFTDRPDAIPGGKVEEIEIRETNQSAPPPALPVTSRSSGSSRNEDTAPAPPSVVITSPANETTIAMGPGNFAVSARVDPPLRGSETLVLLVDGQAYGAAQTGTSWFVEGALRGPHDLVVQRNARGGNTAATSEPVRVYVLRPSIAR